MTDGLASSTIAARMQTLARAALLLLVAASLVAAGVPPALDEDRSVPGYCSPDCPLQHVAHAVAVAPEPAREEDRVEPARGHRRPEPIAVRLSGVVILDGGRAPPRS